MSEYSLFKAKELLNLIYGKYATFHEVGEGEELPTGIESVSARVLTTDGTVRICNLKYDPEMGYYYLDVERSWPPEWIEKYQDNPEYIEARKKLGLPLTKEQERILEDGLLRRLSW